jgi:hypothetical protein
VGVAVAEIAAFGRRVQENVARVIVGKDEIIATRVEREEGRTWHPSIT